VTFCIFLLSIYIIIHIIYRVSQEEWAKLRESVPYVELYRYNPKHLYPKLNGFGDNGQRSLKLWQPVRLYNIFHIISQISPFFKKKLINKNVKYVFWIFPTIFVRKNSHSKRIDRDVTKNVCWSSCKALVILAGL